VGPVIDCVYPDEIDSGEWLKQYGSKLSYMLMMETELVQRGQMIKAE